MTQQLAVAIISIATTMGIGTQLYIHLLDVATAKQCRTPDWSPTLLLNTIYAVPQ